MIAIIAFAALLAAVGIMAGKASRPEERNVTPPPPPPPPPPPAALPSPAAPSPASATPRPVQGRVAPVTTRPSSAHALATAPAGAAPNAKTHGAETPDPVHSPVTVDFSVGVSFNVSGLERLFVNERDLYAKMRDFVAKTLVKMNQHWASSGVFTVTATNPSQKDYGYEVVCDFHYVGQTIPRADIVAYVRQQVTSLGQQIASRLRDVYLDET